MNCNEGSAFNHVTSTDQHSAEKSSPVQVPANNALINQNKANRHNWFSEFPIRIESQSSDRDLIPSVKTTQNGKRIRQNTVSIIKNQGHTLVALPFSDITLPKS